MAEYDPNCYLLSITRSCRCFIQSKSFHLTRSSDGRCKSWLAYNCQLVCDLIVISRIYTNGEQYW